MPLTTQQEFLAKIERYLAARRIGASTLGRRAVGDPMLVFDLRRGRCPNLSIVDRVERFMADNPPVARRTEAA
jgi:hypothetical protein